MMDFKIKGVLCRRITHLEWLTIDIIKIILIKVRVAIPEILYPDRDGNENLIYLHV